MIRVVIADDEHWMRNTIAKCIDWEAQGCCIIGNAKDGLEALELIIKWKPDIVFTDIKMPGIDGLALMERVQELELHTVFIFFSGYDYFEYARKAVDLGALGYLLKPVDETELLKYIKKSKTYILEQKQIRREQEQSFVKRLFDENKIDEKNLEKMQMHMLGNIFCAVAIEAGNKKLLLEVINQEFTKEKISIIYAYTEKGIEILAYASINEDIIAKLDKIFKKMLRQFYTSANDVAAVGIGEAAANLDELHASCIKARRALEYKILKEPCSVIVYKKEYDFDSKTSFIGTDIKKRIQEIFNDSNQSLSKFILEFIENKIYSTKFCVEDLYKFHNDLINIVLGELKKSGIEDIIHKYNQHSLYEMWNQSMSVEQLFVNYRVFLENCKNMVEERELHYYKRIADSVKQYIKEHYAEDISLESIASQLSFHPAYISKIFKDEFGETYVEYVTAYRIDQAKELIASTHLSLYKIAEMVGYRDPKYFSKVFRKQTGMTLAEYANRTRF